MYKHHFFSDQLGGDADGPQNILSDEHSLSLCVVDMLIPRWFQISLLDPGYVITKANSILFSTLLVDNSDSKYRTTKALTPPNRSRPLPPTRPYLLSN